MRARYPGSLERRSAWALLSGGTASTVFQQLGAATNRGPAWQQASVSLTAYAGQSVRMRIAAADASTASLVEAAVDDVRIAQS